MLRGADCGQYDVQVERQKTRYWIRVSALVDLNIREAAFTSQGSCLLVGICDLVTEFLLHCYLCYVLMDCPSCESNPITGMSLVYCPLWYYHWVLLVCGI